MRNSKQSDASIMTIDRWFAQQDKSVEQTYRKMQRGRTSKTPRSSKGAGVKKSPSALQRLIELRAERDLADLIMAASQAHLVEAYLDGRLDAEGHHIEVRMTLSKGKYLVVDGKPILPPSQ
jgi:cell fate regulator YaaT (PSP1 superfamily)